MGAGVGGAAGRKKLSLLFVEILHGPEGEAKDKDKS